MATTMSMIWIVYFLLAAIAMLVLVPQRKIVRLLPFGIVGGAVVAAVVQMIGVWYLSLWRFNYTRVLAYRGIPIFLVLSWLPLMVIFAYWLLSLRTGTARFFFIAAYALVSVGLEYVLLRTGFMVHRNWSMGRTALLALGLHYLLAGYLLAVGRRREERRTIPLRR